MFLIFIGILIWYLVRSQKKKELEMKMAPIREQRCREYNLYVLTWIVFQMLIIEVYEEWSKEGSPYPIGIYHHQFREIGRCLYDGNTPAEEAVIRAATFLKENGYACRIPKTAYHEQDESIYCPTQTVPFYETDFAYQHRPDRTFYQYLHKEDSRDRLLYQGVHVVEPSQDDWRRTHYLASDGTKHPLRNLYYGKNEEHDDDLHNWSAHL